MGRVLQIRRAKTPPRAHKTYVLGEGIVHIYFVFYEIISSDVGSSYPGGEAAPKGWTVRPLKWYVSWVQTVKLAASDSNVGFAKSTYIGEALILL